MSRIGYALTVAGEDCAPPEVFMRELKAITEAFCGEYTPIVPVDSDRIVTRYCVVAFPDEDTRDAFQKDQRLAAMKAAYKFEERGWRAND